MYKRNESVGLPGRSQFPELGRYLTTDYDVLTRLTTLIFASLNSSSSINHSISNSFYFPLISHFLQYLHFFTIVLSFKLLLGLFEIRWRLWWGDVTWSWVCSFLLSDQSFNPKTFFFLSPDQSETNTIPSSNDLILTCIDGYKKESTEEVRRGDAPEDSSSQERILCAVIHACSDPISDKGSKEWVSIC